MDADRFDRLSREVARQADRRSLFKAVAGGAAALLGVAGLRREAAAASGFEGDTCVDNADCGDGLLCRGASRGLLGGLVSGVQYGPPGVSLPFLTGKEGRCRYRNGCGNDGDLCRNAGDCCGGFNCPNNRCRPK